MAIEKNKSLVESLIVSSAVMSNDIGYIKKSVEEISSKLTTEFVTKDEFDPVKRVVYGLVSVVVTAVVGALMTFIIVRQ